MFLFYIGLIDLHQVKCTQEKFYLTTMAVIDLKTHKGE